MKKVIYIALGAMMLSCGAETKFSVTGNLVSKNAGDSVFVKSYESEPKVLASGVTTEGGAFVIEGEIATPTIAMLTAEDGRSLGLVIAQAGDITASIDAQGRYSFAGTELNESYTELQRGSEGISAAYAKATTQEQADSLSAAFGGLVSTTIDANLDNVLGTYLFTGNELSSLDIEQAEARFAQFSAEQQATESMQKAKEMIQAMVNTQVGKDYIDMTLNNDKGEAVALSAVIADNKYVLVDFWATWCSPCRAEMPHLKEAYAEYHDKGFEIYGVSVDSNPSSWTKFVEKQELGWINTIDSEEVNASSIYAVRSIPSNFLINPEGKIIAKNLRGEEVKAKLAELLK